MAHFTSNMTQSFLNLYTDSHKNYLKLGLKETTSFKCLFFSFPLSFLSYHTYFLFFFFFIDSFFFSFFSPQTYCFFNPSSFFFMFVFLSLFFFFVSLSFPLSFFFLSSCLSVSLSNLDWSSFILVVIYELKLFSVFLLKKKMTIYKLVFISCLDSPDWSHFWLFLNIFHGNFKNDFSNRKHTLALGQFENREKKLFLEACF